MVVMAMLIIFSLVLSFLDLSETLNLPELLSLLCCALLRAGVLPLIKSFGFKKFIDFGCCKTSKHFFHHWM